MKSDIRQKKYNFSNRQQENMHNFQQMKQERDRHENVRGKDVYATWIAPEFEKFEKSMQWQVVAGIILLTIIGYALWTGSPIMAITFILIGVVGFIYIHKDPRQLRFSINSDGVVIDKELYPFENIDSFWIFYDPPYVRDISLRMKSGILPHVHIPLEDEDPVEIREILMEFIPEEKQELGALDAFERFLHI